ncbi:MAG: hypothetical protein D3903_04115 [Candidatus Electrothrix sp. GM3_4]|nr:hypothetical protein [Candidatus Electrothrix sp. GM3_4]
MKKVMNISLFLITSVVFLSGGNVLSKNITVDDAESRMEYLEKARSWSKDIRPNQITLEGPKQKKKWRQFSYNEMIECSFQEPDVKDPPNGKTPKFWCVDDNGKSFKVKYENLDTGERNDGVFGEILSTRLFWMLGFPSDATYPVRINCANCPEKPWDYLLGFFAKDKQDQGGNISSRQKRYIRELSQPRVQNLIIDNAVIEIKAPYDEIEMTPHQGWSWKEFKSLLTEQNSYRVQHEALALLAAFIQHADNKPEQQRLVCLDDDRKKGEQCSNTMIMIQDLGFSFGHGYIEGQRSTSTASLNGFVKAPIWSDKDNCITKINYYKWTGEDADVQISEAGRKFLSDLLQQLTDDDLVNLFVPARLYLKPEFINIAGQERPVTIMDWTKAFKDKITEISSHSCPVR